MLRTTILKTGLAVMLTGFFLSSTAVFAQTEENDSTILARHIRETRVEYAMEEFSDHSYNAGLSEKEIDSLLWENRTKVSGGKVLYAPDSAFKIVLVSCESCGGYCNPFWESWLHFNDGTFMVVNKAGFGDVIEIQKLKDGKYLVIEAGHGRTATEFNTTKSAVLLSITDHKLSFIPFPATQSVNPDSVRGAFFFRNTYFNDKYPSWLTFDATSQQLKYQYGVGIEESVEYDYAYIYSGYFIYENGSFIRKEENRLILAD